MQKLKTWRCTVDLKRVEMFRGNPIMEEEQIVVLVKSAKPGQAISKIINLFHGGAWDARMVGMPREIDPLEQLQLFTT